MNCVEVKNFSFAYPGCREYAIDHINMTVAEGSLVVLCGKSGCGKSTLLRQMKTVLSAHGQKEGEILFRGVPIDEVDKRTQAEKIGYVLQNPDNQIVTDKVWHEVAFGLESLGYDTPTIRLRVAEMSSYFGIHDWFMKNVTELSGGQKQLLNLASIMAMNPDLLILDEPTSQLDPITASDFLATVRKINREVGTTVILTEHRLEDVIPWADQVYVLDQGRNLASGTPQEIGEKLREIGHDMFLAMPTPMQIYAGTQSTEHCPLTVSQGRSWLRTELGDPDSFRAKNEAQEKDRPAGAKAAGTAGTDAAGTDAAGTEQAAGAAAPGGTTVAGPAGQAAPGGTNVTGAAGQAAPGLWESEAAAGAQPEADRVDKKDRAISVRDVWFRYERDLPDVVKGLSLDIRRGEFYAIVGGNGTGKSTALSLIGGIRRPYRGKILLDGKPIQKYSDDELYHGMLGVMPQNPQSLFVKKTVREDLYQIIDGTKDKKSAAYPIDMKKADAIEGIAELTRMTGLLDRHPYDLSGGEQQRLALAKILLLRPKILLMDEPTKGIDNHFKKELGDILKLLQKHGVTILMISHDVEFCAHYADRVGLFFQGNVVTGKPTREFFSGNSYYTTAANRMARSWFPEAVTSESVIEEYNRYDERRKSGSVSGRVPE